MTWINFMNRLKNIPSWNRTPVVKRKNYFCIHCSSYSSHIYKIYGKDNLIKLIECTKCGQLVDKFVEYDLIIIIINLILQEEIAYRHLLLNAELKNFWKLGLLFLMTESYCFWCFQKSSQAHSKTERMYQIEANFYKSLIRSAINNLSLHFLIIIIPFIRFRLLKRRPHFFSYFSLWKGMIIAGYAELFELCRLIWSYSTSGPRIYFKDGFFLMSLTQSYKVMVGVSRIEALLTVLICFFAQKYSMTLYDYYFPISGA